MKDEISWAETEKYGLEISFAKIQKEIFEQDIVTEERKLLINKENLKVEQLRTLEYMKRLKNNERMDNHKEYDIFISHSSDDKESFTRPLAEELRKLKVTVWYDEFELKIGDSLREKIDYGLSN